MFIRPQRYRIIIAFLLGLAISVALLTGGYFYYQSQLASYQAEIKEQISAQVEADYHKAHPVKLAYIFSKDKKAGEIITDSDLSPIEIAENATPADSIDSLEEAVGKVIRCDLLASTIASKSLFFSEEDYPDDLREMEYTVVNLPQKLEAGSYVDVRVMFPNGLDYIVLSKKKIIDQTKGENGQASFVWFHLNEEEILRMSSAIVDASLIENSKLYAVTYVAPDIQAEAIRTYPANSEVLELIKNNPNIVAKAIQTLEERNRTAFEERINKDLQQAGKNKAYGSDEYAYPVNAAPTSEVPSQNEPAQPVNSDLDGRL